MTRPQFDRAARKDAIARVKESAFPWYRKEEGFDGGTRFKGFPIGFRGGSSVGKRAGAGVGQIGCPLCNKTLPFG